MRKSGSFYRSHYSHKTAKRLYLAVFLSRPHTHDGFVFHSLKSA
nr:MAG TPA: hypothetical protein [Caudoviricetes sp.]